MSAEQITVSIGTLLTITTGRFVTESFNEFHAAADVLAAQPLMTHQFASAPLADQLRREAIRQHPWLDGIKFPEPEPGADMARHCREWVATMGMTHGTRHILVSPPETRHVPFTEGLPAKFGGSS